MSASTLQYIAFLFHFWPFKAKGSPTYKGEPWTFWTEWHHIVSGHSINGEKSGGSPIRSRGRKVWTLQYTEFSFHFWPFKAKGSPTNKGLGLGLGYKWCANRTEPFSWCWVQKLVLCASLWVKHDVKWTSRDESQCWTLRLNLWFNFVRWTPREDEYLGMNPGVEPLEWTLRFNSVWKTPRKDAFLGMNPGVEPEG